MLYIKGARAVATNLWKTCNIPLIMLLAPKIIGLRNIIRISNIAISFLSPENPGATMEILEGIKNYLKRKGHNSIDQVRGSLKIKNETQVSSVPAG